MDHESVLAVMDFSKLKIIDRKHEVKKDVMAETLDELVNQGKIMYVLNRGHATFQSCEFIDRKHEVKKGVLILQSLDELI